jgi:hypothetical protein
MELRRHRSLRRRARRGIAKIAHPLDQFVDLIGEEADGALA